MRTESKYIRKNTMTRIVLISILMLLFTQLMFAEGDSTSSKPELKIGLKYKISNGVKSIMADVMQEGEDKKMPAENVKLNLYLSEVVPYDAVTGVGLLGSTTTSDDGQAAFTLSPAFNNAMKDKHEFTFVVVAQADKRFDEIQEQIIMKEFYIDLKFNTEDSSTSAIARMTKIENGKEIPMTATEMKLQVKRTFGALPFGEEGLSTDSDGVVTGVLPADLPGNDNKTITVIAKFDDEENNGTIETIQSIPWKIVPVVNKLDQRTLWSTGRNAPIPLVIITVSLILIIWGTIFHLVSILFKIRKLSKTP